jgi:hypothetical protein
VIDEDKSLLAGAASSSQQMRFDAQARKLRTVESGGVIVTKFPHIPSAQAPLLAGAHGGGNLSTEHCFGGMNLDL